MAQRTAQCFRNQRLNLWYAKSCNMTPSECSARFEGIEKIKMVNSWLLTGPKPSRVRVQSEKNNIWKLAILDGRESLRLYPTILNLWSWPKRHCQHRQHQMLGKPGAKQTCSSNSYIIYIYIYTSKAYHPKMRSRIRTLKLTKEQLASVLEEWTNR